MKFGIFFELSVPRPFSPEREREVITNALEQARVADELGFECAWVVEHHFPRSTRTPRRRSCS